VRKERWARSREQFSGVSFAVSSGEALILRGPNGVGKTSLLRILAGLVMPDRGEVLIGDTIGDTPVQGLSSLRRDHVLSVGVTQQLKDEFTALENLRSALALDGVTASDEMLFRALNIVGLLDRRNVLTRRLSQGQRRRIALARMICCPKAIWLLDEPTNALDADGVHLFESIVDAHLARGGLAVIATHLRFTLIGNIRELTMEESV
jgi:heme exporter protein A